MTNAEIKQILQEKGVTSLYHTNSVTTSLTFLNHGGLLSRAYCVEAGLMQTGQRSDPSDRRDGIFDDIFFDATEIQRISGFSEYGPVLFQFRLDVLDAAPEGTIRVTKKNPVEWKKYKMQTEAQRYFLSADEMRRDYRARDFGMHITLRHYHRPLPFIYLERIVISDPQKEDHALFDRARDAIEAAMKKRGIEAEFAVRDYNYNDKFKQMYENEKFFQKHYCIFRKKRGENPAS